MNNKKNNKQNTTDSEIQVDFDLSSLSKELYKCDSEKKRTDFSIRSTSSSTLADSTFSTPKIDTQYTYNNRDNDGRTENKPSLTNLVEIAGLGTQNTASVQSPPVEFQQIARDDNFQNGATLHLDGNSYHYMNDTWRNGSSPISTEAPQSYSEQSGFSQVPYDAVNVEISTTDTFSSTSIPTPSNNVSITNLSSMVDVSQQQIVHPIVEYRTKNLSNNTFVPEGQIIDRNVYQSASQATSPVDSRKQEELTNIAPALETGTIISQGSRTFMKSESGWGELPKQQVQEALSAPSSIVAQNSSLTDVQSIRNENILTELQRLSGSAQPGNYAVCGANTYQFRNDGTWKPADYKDALAASQKNPNVIINATPESLTRQQYQLSALMTKTEATGANNVSSLSSPVAQGKITDDRIYRSVSRTAEPLDDVQRKSLSKTASPLLDVGTIISHESPAGSQLFLQTDDGWKEISRQQMQTALSAPSSIISPNATGLESTRRSREQNILSEVHSLPTTETGSFVVCGNETYCLKDDKTWEKADMADTMSALAKGTAFVLVSAPTGSPLNNKAFDTSESEEKRTNLDTSFSFATLAYMSEKDSGNVKCVNAATLSADELTRGFITQGIAEPDAVMALTGKPPVLSSSIDCTTLDKIAENVSVGTVVKHGDSSYILTNSGWNALSEEQVRNVLTRPASVLTNNAVGLDGIREARNQSILTTLQTYSDVPPGTCAICGNDAFVFDKDQAWVKADRAEIVSSLHQAQTASAELFTSFGNTATQTSQKDSKIFEAEGTYASGYINALAYIPIPMNDGTIRIGTCDTVRQIKPSMMEKSFIQQGAIMDLVVLNSITSKNEKPLSDRTANLLSALPQQDIGTIFKYGNDSLVRTEDGWKILDESDLEKVLSAPSTILAKDAVGLEKIQPLRTKNIIAELEKSNASLGTLAVYGNDAFQLQLDEKDGTKKWVSVDRGQALQFASKNQFGVDVLLPEPEKPIKVSNLNAFQQHRLNTELDILFGTATGGDVVSHHDRYFVRSEGNWVEVSKSKASDILATKSFKNPKDFNTSTPNNSQNDEKDQIRVSKLLEKEDGFSAPLQGDSQDDSEQLKIRYSTGRRDKVASATKVLVGMGVNAVNTALMSDPSIAGEGYKRVVQTARVARDTVGVASVELVKSLLRKPLQRELNTLMKQYGVNSAEELLSALNQRLRNAGHQPLPMVKGVKLQVIASRQLGRTLIAGKLQGVAAKELADIYKTAHRVGVLTTFDSGGVRISERLTKGMRLFVSQSAKYGGLAGVGLANTYRLITTIYRSARTTIRATRLTARVTRIVAKKAANAAAKLALLALRKTGGDVILKKAADRIGKTAVGQTFSSVRSKISDRKKKLKKKEKRKFGKKRERFSKRIRSKTKKKLNSFQTKIWNKLTNRFGFLRKFQQAASMISMISAMIAALISWLISLIFILLAVIASILVVVVVVMMLWSHFITLFNFSNQADKARAAAITSLSEAYEEDMNRIMELKSQGYESVNITYENVKNQDAYNENVGTKLSTGDGKTDDSTYKQGSIYTNESFQQTSNAAEILSMSCVKFDYDIGDGTDDDDSGKRIPKRKLKKYVKGMYHGSHEIVVTENVTQDVDEKGNVIEHKTADVVYRSYFYDDLFDKTEADETPMTFIQSGFSDGTAEGVTTEAGIYAYLRDAGFSHNGACGIMGNAQQESTFNPRCQTGQYYGLFQWDSEAKNRLMTYCSTNNLDYTTVAGQISFVAYDVGQGESSTGRAFKYTKIASILKDATNSPEVCASVFCVGYERCVGGSDTYKYKSLYWPYSMSKTYSYQQLNKRIAYANAFANKYAQYKDDWSALKETVSSSDTNSLVDYAKSWVGKIPYVYGGPGRGHTLEECASKQLGTDCSGFVASVFKHFGVSVPSSSSGYNDSKKAVNANAIQPGDIVVWPGSHVAIYIGNDQIVHAANERVGITISKLSSENKYHSQTPRYYRYYTPVSSGTSNGGSYDIQTRAEYKNIQYGHNSIYNSGCGPTSVGNVIRNYVKPGSSTPTTVDMCNFAVKVGARESGGTNMYTLLSAAGSTYGFTYQYSSSYSALVNHLKAGKMAVIHTSGVEPFSSGGHFLAAIGMSGDKIVILDPFWTQSKKERYSKNGCTLTNVTGKVIVPKNVFTNGIDGYYLITKK